MSKYFRTAKTIDQVGKIPANTYVAVHFTHNDETTGRAMYTICSNLSWQPNEMEFKVDENQLTSFCM